jgi:hypothetical protein
VELGYQSVRVQGAQCHVRKSFNGNLQLLIIRMEHNIGLPLLQHIVGVPQGRKPSGQRLRWIYLRKGVSFRHFPSDKCDQNDQPAEVEFVSQILSFATVFLEFIDEVTRPIHLHALHTFSCDIHHEPSDLCGVVLPYELAIYELESEAHCAILYIGYLVASLSFFNFVVSFLDALCQGEV